MELAPIANIRETDVESVGTGGSHPRGGVDDGLDDGFGVPTNPRPPNGGLPEPRIPLPRTPSPSPGPSIGGTPGPGRGGYYPIPTDPTLPGVKPGKKPLDVNTYATKKTVAQGMMDLALLTANANQLRYVIEAGRYGNYGVNYYVSLTLIIFSILFQLVIGVMLIFMGRYNVSQEHHAIKADKLNNWVVLGVFLITIINVFISSFAIEPMTPEMIKLTMMDAREIVTERVQSVTDSLIGL
ncbi:hypothetical protein SK128_021279 [Halocaridina rubra]|uniref:Ninjurin-1 n=1 Tax=Halocaridina rubra TaxID=373956 RepID=A0AAN8ZXC5_HALRR